MVFFVLAAIVLTMAAALWYTQAQSPSEEIPPPLEKAANQTLRQLLEQDPHIADPLAEAVLALDAAMAHPKLGGPGFLLIQFPMPDSGEAVVTAQYPNIREALYRRIVRQELDRDSLAAAGMPEALLSLEPSFETESGGVVMLSVRVKGLPAVLTERLGGRRERIMALESLAEALEAKLPQFSVRTFGADLLLSPLREGAEVPAP